MKQGRTCSYALDAFSIISCLSRAGIEKQSIKKTMPQETRYYYTSKIAANTVYIVIALVWCQTLLTNEITLSVGPFIRVEGNVA